MPSFWCKCFPYFITFIPTMMHTSAIYLTVYLAVQRYFFLKKSSKFARKLNNLPRTRWISVFICFVAICTEIPKIITSYNDTHVGRFPGQNSTHRFCVHHYFAWISSSRIVKNYYFASYFWFQAIFVHGLPCLLLVILTGLLLSKLRRADRRRKRLMSSIKTAHRCAKESERSACENGSLILKDDASSSRTSSFPQKKQPKYLRSTTKMLVVVIVIFLIIEIPVACFYILHVLSITVRIMPNEWYRWINVCIIFRNVLILLSYPVNFAIYCGMSRQFRTTAKGILTRKLSLERRRQDDGTMTTMVRNLPSRRVVVDI